MQEEYTEQTSGIMLSANGRELDEFPTWNISRPSKEFHIVTTIDGQVVMESKATKKPQSPEELLRLYIAIYAEELTPKPVIKTVTEIKTIHCRVYASFLDMALAVIAGLFVGSFGCALYYHFWSHIVS